jgi:hypothetical protein
MAAGYALTCIPIEFVRKASLGALRLSLLAVPLEFGALTPR